MRMPPDIPVSSLAPCGMDCYVCYTHLRTRKRCLGCRGADESKPGHCRQCKIKDCALGRGLEFCSACPTFPCAVVKRLDRNYRQRYHVSLVDNGRRIAAVGAGGHLIEERARWCCPACGGVVCLHDRVCSECGQAV